MKKNKCKKMGIFSFYCVLILFLSGCASPKLWYKPGRSQVDFDVDNQECLRVAEDMGRQATITGKKIEPDVFTNTYNNCLFARGWTHTPPGAEQKYVKVVKLARINGNTVTVFNQHLLLPSGFKLINNQITGFEDVRMQTLFLQGAGPVFLNINIQQTLSRQFDSIDYPVNEPFFVFEKGRDKSCKPPVNWTVFAGDYRGEWVAGIGAYYLIDKNKRISIVLTRAIPSQKSSPPPGLQLTRSQELAVEAFSDEWLGVVKAGFFEAIVAGKK